MKAISTLLNLSWNIVGIVAALFSFPKIVRFDLKRFAIVFTVKDIWWMKKSVRAATICQVVILTDKTIKNDLEHELIHVEQALRTPFIHPILYQLELINKGYKNNKYEVEAYARSKSQYIHKNNI